MEGGEAFVTNRYMTVFFVTLPIIGLLERYYQFIWS